MSFDGLLNHKCDIFHMLRTDASPGYNLPSSPTFSYPESPDLSAVPCHFSVKGGNLRVVQKEPQANLTANLAASIKLVLPAKTDVRINDKIVDTGTGIEYTAELPCDIRGHHIYVLLRRTSRQEAI